MQPPPSSTSFRARLVSRRDAGAGMLIVELEPPAAIAPSYTRPGQYIWAELGVGEGGYFVLGCLHGKRTWEIVIRPSGDAAEALARAPLGTSIEAGGPFGVGFPRAHGRRLIMAATGRAIAAVRAVMQERIADGDGSKTTLFIGVTREAELPLPWEAKSWLENGAEVVICTSQQELEDATHAKGRVQDVVARRLDAPAGTPLLLVGHAGMIEAMKAWAKTKDLDAYVNV